VLLGGLKATTTVWRATATRLFDAPYRHVQRPRGQPGVARGRGAQDRAATLIGCERCSPDVTGDTGWARSPTAHPEAARMRTYTCRRSYRLTSGLSAVPRGGRPLSAIVTDSPLWSKGSRAHFRYTRSPPLGAASRSRTRSTAPKGSAMLRRRRRGRSVAATSRSGDALPACTSLPRRYSGTSIPLNALTNHNPSRYEWQPSSHGVAALTDRQSASGVTTAG
jgi:hypothetical protein